MTSKIYNEEVKFAFDHFREKIREGLPVEDVEKMIDDYDESHDYLRTLLNHANKETIKDCIWLIKEKLDKQQEK